MASNGDGKSNKRSNRSGNPARADALQTTAELVSHGVELASEPSHAASMSGIELLVEIAKLADQVLAASAPRPQHHCAEPVDPRRCVDPRKRILPR
ncbi:hypothetical protein C0Z18_30745 [Trinickia dabaoshanensis]|uniref:Uncharacterized protein n=1 Tax=Trinickia dabaoshanensis TaxID=564714 RepID=A0A2N7VBT0_9BURK|nr:hypothetical protein [Trinickia dabaoshanensis]PMS14628.1 hypothetical protein C0Z18_30745 [Trinickia dabaoshanensis]